MKIDGYKFGNKNNWRRWVWNRISERICRDRKDALVVYLPGMEDLDRSIAISHGFNPNNLIAVDRSEEVVERLKEKGALCINGDFVDVIKCFRKTKTKIDVVVADYCCGLTECVSESAMWWSPELTRNVMNNHGVIAINLMRGRDSGEMLDQYKDKKDKHRAKMFVDYMAGCAGAMYAASTFWAKNHNPDIFGDLLDAYIEFFPGFFFEEDDVFDFNTWKDVVIDSFDPEYNSYKSGRIVMDSSIISIDTNLALPVIDQDDMEVPEIINEVRAILAIRTMKINGKLRSSPVS